MLVEHCGRYEVTHPHGKDPDCCLILLPVSGADTFVALPSLDFSLVAAVTCCGFVLLQLTILPHYKIVKTKLGIFVM